jgi:hypothetical protein
MTLSPLYRNIHASKKGCPIASFQDLGAAAPNTENLFFRFEGRSCRLAALAKLTTGIIRPAMRLARDYIALVKFSMIRSCYLGAASPLAYTAGTKSATSPLLCRHVITLGALRDHEKKYGRRLTCD